MGSEMCIRDREGALKLKEISYIHAEGYAGGEMKHGPIALIDDGVPVVVVAPKGHGYEKVLSNLAEVAFPVPPAPPLLSPLVSIIPLQFLAYHVADLKGTDVDQPRNLAKSVTVE